MQEQETGKRGASDDSLHLHRRWPRNRRERHRGGKKGCGRFVRNSEERCFVRISDGNVEKGETSTGAPESRKRAARVVTGSIGTPLREPLAACRRSFHSFLRGGGETFLLEKEKMGLVRNP